MFTHKERAELCTHPVSKKLFSLMKEKETNLAVSADVTRAEELLCLAEQVGPEICLFKTHVDIIADFTPSLIKELRAIADKYHFLLFEDRKFADIGNTVLHQYEGGIYKIAEWADIINAHILPGPGIIEGLRTIGLPRKRGLLLLAQMSSQGSLLQGAYTDQTVKFAEEYSDFVIGFIALQKLCKDPQFLHMTPGIQLEEGRDALGQQYQTPESAMKAGTDILIVGRSIYKAQDPQSEARLFRERGWKAYHAR